MELMEHQLDAIEKLSSGKVLWGGTGSGKSAAVLGYYVKEQSPRDIFVITTAKKRDSLDWEAEAARFGVGTDRDATLHGTITIDSWNNIGQYEGIEDAFFIFDEQRLVGSGAWVHSFYKIARRNNWVLLSATPGDTWMDYAPVFIANGFYKNITQFKLQHVLYAPYIKFPMIIGYLNEQKLEILRNDVLVEMPFIKHTERFLNHIPVGYDLELFKDVWKRRWNIFEDRPCRDAAELFRVLRRVVNSDPSRLWMIQKLTETHPRMIIFYNFDYELEILRTLDSGYIPVYELNGHRHDPVPEGDRWVYLVQYVAGAEAWNCTTTNAMVLYSLTYSYKNFEQAQGRIDRLDTSYHNLHYYILVSNSTTDRGILRALKEKKNFNERKFMNEIQDIDENGEEIIEGCVI
jgi:hypothetical protein